MITVIAAIAENNCIGKNNNLPWNIPEDLKHFRTLTSGKKVLMGRKTFESIMGMLGKPLPNRLNIVITAQADFSAPEAVEVFHSVEDALAAHANEDLWIIGGAQIYSETIDRADRLEITHIHKTVEDDAFFPTIDPLLWKESGREDHDGFSFVTYERTS
jgi:dihydrofolate reductase